jgi:hypothetical protein
MNEMVLVGEGGGNAQRKNKFFFAETIFFVFEFEREILRSAQNLRKVNNG